MCVCVDTRVWTQMGVYGWAPVRAPLGLHFTASPGCRHHALLTGSRYHFSLFLFFGVV
eukprot:NODE_7025_length_422_cov_158.882038_g5403_i0.p6 GENE.NODE_7025_length_422_cov_158.882038_g5403_i0~~NODE_7025_length_422_cov_158.882038_g5403_i0.p6  ORF type:complete len:58 (-),score=4.97 NODE_7025_length_422_cov_158.882038_g5403_i0:60-233(-)